MMLSSFGYRQAKFLGNGGFGRVYLCKDQKNQDVCVKEISKESSNLKTIKSEVYILSELKHPRIIKFINSFSTENAIYIVMEYAAQGTLRDYLRRQRLVPLSQEVLLSIFKDILMGIEYLHIRHVIHRDLKPENVLISEHGRMKICDFGISAIHDKQRMNKDGAGTILYIAPEILKGCAYDFKADIWSLGCVLYELCTFFTPFSGKDKSCIVKIIDNSQFNKISCKHLQYTDGLKNLCGRMLTIPPSMRIATPDIVRDPLIMLSYYNLYFDYYRTNSL